MQLDLEKIRIPSQLDELSKDDLAEFLGCPRGEEVRYKRYTRDEAWFSWRNKLWFLWRDTQGWQQIDLSGADLGRAYLRGVDFGKADLRNANLFQAELQGANLHMANLEGANLTGAILEGANIHFAYLRDANLRQAHLRDVDLAGIDVEKPTTKKKQEPEKETIFRQLEGRLHGVHLYQAHLRDVLGLRYEQFLDEHGASTIWEETEGRFFEAKEVYKTLKGYFEDAGDYKGANWAFVHEKKMEKLMYMPRQLRWLYRLWRKGFVDDNKCCTPSFFPWLSLEFAEKVAGYGNSLLLPLLWILAFILLFALIYLAFGMITTEPDCYHKAVCQPSASFVNAVLFSLGAVTTIDVGVYPLHSATGLLTTAEAFVGIALTGLFGFVLGNRLRFS